MQSLFLLSQQSVLPFQDNLLSRTLLTQKVLYNGKPAQISMNGPFPSITDKQPFQDHLPSITLPTLKARFNFVGEF